MNQDLAMRGYRTMVLIRVFEERIVKLHGDGRLPGFMHVSIGQEAIPSGVSLALRQDDFIATTHRGHGDVIAKGVEVEGMIAEMMARQGGVCRAKGGSMHIGDFQHGVLGAFSIVGAGLPIALGAALSAKRQGTDRVAVAYFGDGAIAQGAAHESFNMATLWQVPVIFVRQNNQYAESTPVREYLGIPDVTAFAASYGMSAVRADGNDLEAVYEVAAAAVDRARRGDGPSFLELDTYRWYGHNIGDKGVGRPPEEVEAWRGRDPILSFGRCLIAAGLADEDLLVEIHDEAVARIDDAVDAADAMEEPPVEWALEDVFADAGIIAAIGGGLR